MTTEPFATLTSRLLLGVLILATLVAWSPRHWPVALLHFGLFALGLVWILWNAAHPQAGSWRGLAILAPMAFAGIWGAVQLLLGTTVYAFATTRSLLYWSANAT